MIIQWTDLPYFFKGQSLLLGHILESADPEQGVLILFPCRDSAAMIIIEDTMPRPTGTKARTAAMTAISTPGILTSSGPHFRTGDPQAAQAAASPSAQVTARPVFGPIFAGSFG